MKPELSVGRVTPVLLNVPVPRVLLIIALVKSTLQSIPGPFQAAGKVGGQGLTGIVTAGSNNYL